MVSGVDVFVFVFSLTLVPPVTYLTGMNGTITRFGICNGFNSVRDTNIERSTLVDVDVEMERLHAIDNFFNMLRVNMLLRPSSIRVC